MLIDRYAPEDVFARVPELADQTDPVLVELDHLLDDDTLYQQVRSDLAQPLSPHPGAWTAFDARRSPPAAARRAAPVRLELPGDGAAGSRLLGPALVLPRLLPARSRRDHVAALGSDDPTSDRCTPSMTAWRSLAKQARVTQGRKLRLDSTCVQTAIHHPTDSGLLVDSVRVLTRLLRQAKPLVAAPLAACRRLPFAAAHGAPHGATVASPATPAAAGGQPNRAPAHAVSDAGDERHDRPCKQARGCVRRWRRSCRRAAGAPPPAAQPAAPGARSGCRRRSTTSFPSSSASSRKPRPACWTVGQVPAREKVLSLFEPHTRLIPRHKGGAAVEFGRQVMLAEVDGGIVTRFHHARRWESPIATRPSPRSCSTGGSLDARPGC